MATVTLRPNADDTDGGWTPNTGTDLWSCVVDDVDSPNDADFIQGTVSGTTTACLIAMDDTPADLATVTAAVFRIRISTAISGDDQFLFTMAIRDSSGVNIITPSGLGLTEDGTWQNIPSAGSFNGAQDKARWDGAKFFLEGSTFAQSMGADGNRLRISSVEVDLTYTAAAAVPTPPHRRPRPAYAGRGLISRPTRRQ